MRYDYGTLKKNALGLWCFSTFVYNQQSLHVKDYGMTELLKILSDIGNDGWKMISVSYRADMGDEYTFIKKRKVSAKPVTEFNWKVTKPEKRS